MTLVPSIYLSLAARLESKAVVITNNMIAPPVIAPSTALKTDFTDNCVTRWLQDKRSSSLVSD